MKFNLLIKIHALVTRYEKLEDLSGIFYSKHKTFYYVKNGLIHNENGPAILYDDGQKEWWINGKLHREDGPAIEHLNRTKRWYLNGKYNRLDGPALEYVGGIKCWYLNDQYHRLDGPAIEFPDGRKSWFINGEQYSKEEYNKKIKEIENEI